MSYFTTLQQSPDQVMQHLKTINDDPTLFQTRTADTASGSAKF
jgi:hypothetical protein